MLAHVGAASLAGEETEMKIIFYLINSSPLGCPSHAITAERLKYLIFLPLELQRNLGLY